MSVNENDLGKIVVLRTAQGAEIGRGKMVAYCDAPTVTIQTHKDGSQTSWRADLASVVKCDHRWSFSDYEGLFTCELDMGHSGSHRASKPGGAA